MSGRTAIVGPQAGGEGLRALMVGGAGMCALLGASGFTQVLVFDRPSALKYALTVIAPLIVLTAASAAEPLLVLACAVVVVAPFAAFTAELAGAPISPLAVLLLAAALVAVARGPADRIRSGTGWVGLAAILLLLPAVVGGSDPGQFLVLLLTMVSVAWVVARAARLPGGLIVVLAAIVASAAVQGAIAVWEFRTGQRLNLYGGAGREVFGQDYFFEFGDQNRPVGSFFDPISLGNILALSLPIALAIVCEIRRPIARIAAVAAAGLTTVALVLSLSRSSWIGAVVGLLVVIVLLPTGRRIRVALSVVAAVAVSIVVSSQLSDDLAVRARSVLDPTASSVATAEGDRERLRLQGAALRVAQDNLAIGVGAGRLEPVLREEVGESIGGTHAHSTYLQVFAEAGVAGALALALLILGLCRDLFVATRTTRVLGAGLVGSTTAVLIVWLTDYTVRYASVAASIAVLLGAIAAARHSSSGAGGAPAGQSPGAWGG